MLISSPVYARKLSGIFHFISLEMVRWLPTYLGLKEAKKSWKTENNEPNLQKITVDSDSDRDGICFESQAVFWFLFPGLICT